MRWPFSFRVDEVCRCTYCYDGSIVEGMLQLGWLHTVHPIAVTRIIQNKIDDPTPWWCANAN